MTNPVVSAIKDCNAACDQAVKNVVDASMHLAMLAGLMEDLPQRAQKAMNDYIASCVALFAARDPAFKSLVVDVEGDGHDDVVIMVYANTDSTMNHENAVAEIGILLREKMEALRLDPYDFVETYPVAGTPLSTPRP